MGSQAPYDDSKDKKDDINNLWTKDNDKAYTMYNIILYVALKDLMTIL